MLTYEHLRATRLRYVSIDMTYAELPPQCCAAAIVNDGSCDVDALLADVVRLQVGQGLRVRGLVLSRDAVAPGCQAAMVLQDIDTAEQYLVSQPLGGGSKSCRGDPQGFARASQVLRRALDEEPDLIVSNRFGGLEATGGGLRAELLELMSRGVPLLTVVAPRYLEAWRDFAGTSTELPPDRAAIDAWLETVVGPRPHE